MVYLYLAILGLYVLLFFLSRKEKISAYRDEDRKKTYPWKNVFLKAAVWCLRHRYVGHIYTGHKNVGDGHIGDKRVEHSHAARFSGQKGRYKTQMQRSRLGSNLKLLHPELSERYQVQAFYVRQCSLVLSVIFVGNLFSLCVAISAKTSGILQDGSYIERRTYGQGDIEVAFSAQIEGEEPAEIFYTVEEQKYTPEEMNRMFREAVPKLGTAILGGNNSLESVTENLDLITYMEGYPFQITWESDSYSLIQTDGSVRNKDLAESEIVTLTACFRYEEQEFEEIFPVQVCPAVLTDRERLLKSIESSLEEQDQVSRTDERLELPGRIGSKNVIWKEVIQDSSGYFFLMICAAAFFLFYSGEKDVERSLAERNRELLRDYPEIIHKLALYMGAGMTIRNAFGKMGDDYRKQKVPGKKRYVYEEILLLSHELQSGIPEAEAYAHLGKRCRLQPYMKLATLLSQNLRKGTGDLLLKLQQEAAAAFEERKNRAKKAGEEAGTKLLLPMMMMLCIVMVLIMIPAYFTI